jgi:thiamine biosynthesis lipoprotein
MRRRSSTRPDVADALSKVGYQKLRLDQNAGTVELLEPSMRIDLGGIAVGYAVDEAMQVFRDHGVTRVLIDAAGDIAVGDPPPGREAWRIEIEPLRDGAGPKLVLELKNCAVTTSGDASKFVEFDGVRYSHIVDPQTGYGLTRRTSATVIAPDCITADSLATTLNVLGPERGLELIAETPGVEASIDFIDDDGQPMNVQSPGFGDRLEQCPAAE